MKKALELRMQPMPIVRIGLVGLGRRGMRTLERYAFIDGAEIKYLLDTDRSKANMANRELTMSSRPSAEVLEGDDAWDRLCRAHNVDLIYICTDWESHCRLALDAMAHGKCVVVEVPAATSVQECWNLVDAAEEYGVHCFMAENCCYDNFALATYTMAKEGLFGELTHCEGAYIHDLSESLGIGSHSGNPPLGWMERDCARHAGNPYPTHGMGSIGWLLNLHRGDRMKSIVSLTSRGYGKDNLEGRVNSSLIMTEKGRTILLQFDITTPRPYSRIQTICGTRGFAQKYPLPTLNCIGGQGMVDGEKALDEIEKYMTSPAARCWKEGREKKVENEMNYAMDKRLIHCLRYGLPLDIDVYDAAEWSCLAELSAASASQGGMPVEIPDFTRGSWDVLKGHRMY